MRNNNIYSLTKLLVKTYKNLRKEIPSTHKFLAKARNLFFASKEFHLADSDIEFLNKEMDFLEEAYNKIFEKDYRFLNLTETELEDIKKNLEFFTLKYDNYYEYLKFAREIFRRFLIFMFSSLISIIAGKKIIQNFPFSNKNNMEGINNTINLNITDIILYISIAFIFVYMIYASFPQMIVNIQAKREILKEIEILIDKRISQLKTKSF
ncbi:MAG: hypothetical protein GXO22_00875 [Aquificae bacterium]|nr:hypothetical protein [Aquificota bacterium]